MADLPIPGPPHRNTGCLAAISDRKHLQIADAFINITFRFSKRDAKTLLSSEDQLLGRERFERQHDLLQCFEVVHAIEGNNFDVPQNSCQSLGFDSFQRGLQSIQTPFGGLHLLQYPLLNYQVFD